MAATFTLPTKLRKQNLSEIAIVIGISTGGPPCLSQIFEALPAESPPVLVVQHMPKGFTKAMAQRLNTTSELEVTEAAGGEIIEPGKGYIAPGDKHIRLELKNGKPTLVTEETDLVSGHRPSADVLFDSAVQVYGNRLLAVIMTGMGRDGATGIKKIRDIGGFTVAQDEGSCTVFGMPKMAIREDGIDAILSLDQIVIFLKNIGLARKRQITMMGGKK